MTQTPRSRSRATAAPAVERRGQEAAARFTPGMAVRLKDDPERTGTVTDPPDNDDWWDSLLIRGVAKWDQLLVEDPSGLRRWCLVADLEPVPAEPKTEETKAVKPDARP